MTTHVPPSVLKVLALGTSSLVGIIFAMARRPPPADAWAAHRMAKKQAIVGAGADPRWFTTAADILWARNVIADEHREAVFILRHDTAVRLPPSPPPPGHSRTPRVILVGDDDQGPMHSPALSIQHRLPLPDPPQPHVEPPTLWEQAEEAQAYECPGVPARKSPQELAREDRERQDQKLRSKGGKGRTAFGTEKWMRREPDMGLRWDFQVTHGSAVDRSRPGVSVAIPHYEEVRSLWLGVERKKIAGGAEECSVRARDRYKALLKLGRPVLDVVTEVVHDQIRPELIPDPANPSFGAADRRWLGRGLDEVAKITGIVTRRAETLAAGLEAVAEIKRDVSLAKAGVITTRRKEERRDWSETFAVDAGYHDPRREISDADLFRKVRGKPAGARIRRV